MNIFVAGASGAIGRPLIKELIRNGHSVVGMTRNETGARKLNTLGARPVLVDAFDAEAVRRAVNSAKPEVIIDQLTALPKNPADMASALPGDRRLRIEGGSNLRGAALACGVRRLIQQSSGFLLKTGSGLGDETEKLVTDAGGDIGLTAQMYEALEARTLSSSPMEGVVLRYGFFYGPDTWYHPDGGAASIVRQQLMPIIGEGEGVWSFVHIEDAASATVAALTSEPGIYNVVDDDASAAEIWLPAFAKAVGAPSPPRISEMEALGIAGESALYYHTKLRGSSNTKARINLHFEPRSLEWLNK
jgi:nucleoside-diphosphate-sugar epimerase